jgi:hypothetical protein
MFMYVTYVFTRTLFLYCGVIVSQMSHSSWNRAVMTLGFSDRAMCCREQRRVR